MRAGTASLLLLLVTAIWGWTFVVVHQAVAVYGVVPFLALRFGVAAVATLVLWGRHLDRASLRTGAWIGAVLALGYLLQTWGLRHTTPTNSGLITGLFVILAPVADRLLYRTRLHPVAWASVALSLVGMTLLTGRLPTDLALGDLLTLGCAIAFGVHIAVLSRHSPGLDSRALGTSQMVALAIIFAILWPATAPLSLPPARVWPAILLTGLLASALAYFIQTAVQRHLTAVRTAVILTTEPLFAGLFGYLLSGDRLSGLQQLGAALILGALIVSETVPRLARSRA